MSVLLNIPICDLKKLDQMNFVKLYKRLDRDAFEKKRGTEELEEFDQYYRDCNYELDLVEKRDEAMEDIQNMSEKEFIQKLLTGTLPEFERAGIMDEDFPFHSIRRIDGHVNGPDIAYDRRADLRWIEANDYKMIHFVDF